MQRPPCPPAGTRRRSFTVVALLVPFLLLALVVTAGASAAVSVAASARAVHTGVASVSASARGITQMSQLEVQVLAAINDVRRSQGVVPLRWNPVLSAAATRHSLSMAEHGFFTHASLDGSPFWKRDSAVYPKGSYRFWSVGENLAWASPALSANQAIELWLASPHHRRNMLSPAWREVGLGAVHAVAAGGVYEGRPVTIVTADFGVRHS